MGESSLSRPGFEFKDPSRLLDSRKLFFNTRPMFAAFLTVSILLGAAPASAPAKIIPVTLPNGEVIEAELARTPPQRSMGLMFRQNLAPDQGMLFVFDFPDDHQFWMRNTLIPLDIIWMDSSKTVVHIKSNVPPCKDEPCPTYSAGKMSIFVLELAAGRAAQLGIKVGDRIEF